MITQVNLSVRPATPADRRKLANLIHFELYVHRHLDWRTPLDWIGSDPYLVAEQNRELVGAIACPPDPSPVAWIRLFAAASTTTIDRAWDILWPGALERLKAMPDLEWVEAIPLQRWFQNLLEESNFIRSQQVDMLSWERGRIPRENPRAEVAIRPMNKDDLSRVAEVDMAAFSSVWQNSRSSLEQAYLQAVVATVAEEEGRILGYQISTATPMGGHLARLAVIPEAQGRGVGYALVHDLLMQFDRRGAQVVSVNTQQDNLTSLALYQKAGFRRTGEEFPVYQYRLRADR